MQFPTEIHVPGLEVETAPQAAPTTLYPPPTAARPASQSLFDRILRRSADPIATAYHVLLVGASLHSCHTFHASDADFARVSRMICNADMHDAGDASGPSSGLQR